MDLRNNKALTPVESGMPIRSITIDLTTKCNLACDYCFTHLSQGCYQPETIKEEMAKKIIDWALDPGTRGNEKKVDISFWGGEPLLEWDLLKKLVLYGEEKAKEQGVKITFGGTTNVTLLTEDKFDFLDEHKIFFLLSIDGIKEHHDAHRVFKNGKGSWDTAIANAKKVLERWPEYNVRLSYSTETVATILEDIKFLYDFGFRSIAYSPVCEGDWTPEKLDDLSKSWDAVADWYKELHAEGKPIPHIKYIDDGCKKHFAPEHDSPPCGAGRGYVGVTVDGSIFPCHRFHKFLDQRPWYEKEVCLGHIDYGILNHEWRKNFTEWMPETHMEEACKSCKAYRHSCTGGCWASNWDLCGSLSKNPQIACSTTLENMRIADRLLNELGSQFAQRYQGNKRGGGNNIPMAQGCVCYNTEDILYGRKTINMNEPYSCLCNMATYGSQPRQVTSCTCYNLENDRDGITHYDMSGAQCGRFTLEKKHDCGGECECGSKDPIQKAIEYLRNENIEIEKLSEIQRAKIEEFMNLLEENKMKKADLTDLNATLEVLEQ